MEAESKKVVPLRVTLKKIPPPAQKYSPDNGLATSGRVPGLVAGSSERSHVVHWLNAREAASGKSAPLRVTIRKIPPPAQKYSPDNGLATSGRVPGSVAGSGALPHAVRLLIARAAKDLSRWITEGKASISETGLLRLETMVSRLEVMVRMLATLDAANQQQMAADRPQNILDCPEQTLSTLTAIENAVSAALARTKSHATAPLAAEADSIRMQPEEQVSPVEPVDAGTLPGASEPPTPEDAEPVVLPVRMDASAPLVAANDVPQAQSSPEMQAEAPAEPALAPVSAPATAPVNTDMRSLQERLQLAMNSISLQLNKMPPQSGNQSQIR